MSLDNQEIKNIYLISTAVIIMVIMLLALSAYKSEKRYKENNLIAIKTSKGLIKMNAAKVADHLSNIQADLSRHSGYERTSKYDIEINEVLDRVKLYIERNLPSDNQRSADIKAHIKNKLRCDDTKSNIAHDSVVSHEDPLPEEYIKLDELIRHVDVLISMIKQDECNNGMIDIYALENISYLLDNDANHPGVEFSQPDNDNVDLDVNNVLVARSDPFMISRTPMFSAQVSQIEGLHVEAQLRDAPVVNKKQYSQGPQNVRNAQQRSQMFRENNKRLGLKHYVDEDLLFTPTYDSMAL